MAKGVKGSQYGFVLAVDPGSTTGVALCEKETGTWRATEIPGKGAYLRGEGRSIDGVQTDGALMYLDEMAMAQEVCVWASTAIDEVITEILGTDIDPAVFGPVGEYGGGLGSRVQRWREGDLTEGDLVVIEDFLLRPPKSGQRGANVGSRDRSGLSAPRVSLSLVTWLDVLDWNGANGVGLKLQSAANAKHVINDQRLRSAGLWVRGSEHARDALRHMALACR